jgi:hypothetical protein
MKMRVVFAVSARGFVLANDDSVRALGVIAVDATNAAPEACLRNRRREREKGFIGL